MNIRRTTQLLLVLVAVVLLCQPIFAQNSAHQVVSPASVPAGYARPHSWIVPLVNGGLDPAYTHGGCNGTINPCYYFAADIVKAYGTNLIVGANGGAGMTVGIVDAYYNSQTEADLITFSTFMGLPACTIGNGCLTIVGQSGGAPTAGFNAGWAQETDLDVQWVHAIAPNAKILLVTANDNYNNNLGTAEGWAMAHADVVSNSWGSGEYSGETSNDGYYSPTTVPILFSSGDTGAVVEHPCASPWVTCVGGTNLATVAVPGLRKLESAWSGSSGGCSLYESVLSAQIGFSTSACGTARGIPDIAALADPNSGAIVYLGTNASGSTGGYYIFGGTSLACPLMAAVVADIDAARVAVGKNKLGSNFATLAYQGAISTYYHYRFYDVTTGTSGFPAVAGWDRATGLGVTLNPAFSTYLVSLP